MECISPLGPKNRADDPVARPSFGIGAAAPIVAESVFHYPARAGFLLFAVCTTRTEYGSRLQLLLEFQTADGQ